jgi:hypothetical protein
MLAKSERYLQKFKEFNMLLTKHFCCRKQNYKIATNFDKLRGFSLQVFRVYNERSRFQ